MDFVTYRIPGEDKSFERRGIFRAADNKTEPSGFIVTDFLHQRLWYLEEQDGTIDSLHLGKERPYVISQRDYQIEAQGMLHAFPVMEVEKAVYSRVKQVLFPLQKASELFEKLCEAYPGAFVYLVSSEAFGTWIGATPELLLHNHRMQLDTVALAGTRKTGENREWLQKEQEEHAFVTRHILETLQRNACAEVRTEGPYDAESGPVVHLKTAIQATLGRPNAWEIALDLHPTPAVCGTPRMKALDLILSREMHERDLYTGMIGLMEEGEKRLFVNLRCAQLFENQAFLYVGGGYTIDSIPDLEWEETENKARTLEKFMNLLNA